MERLHPHLRWRNINLVLFGLILIALGIVFGPVALNAPTVLRVTPADGASGANPAAGVQIVFSQWVRPESVQSAVSFDPPAEFAVIGSGFPRPGPAIITIQPAGGLRYGASYRLSLAAGVRNMLGRASDQSLSVAFATAPYVAVARFGPGQGAQAVPLNAPITVEFGAPVVPAAQIAAAAEDPRLADSLPQPLALQPAVQGIGRWLSPTLFGFYPSGGLRAATDYTASLRADVTPDGSARLEQPVSWSFRTAAPLLAGTRPFDGAIDTPVSGEVEVRLEQDVDAGSAGQAFVLRQIDTGAPVPGSVHPLGGGFLFKPSVALQRGARYEASLGPGIVSSAGARLNDRPLTWSFSVIGDLEVAQVEPPPDTAEVLTDTRRISVRFNHPVVALTSIDSQAGLPQPITIEPKLEGLGRWLDTSTYVFTPKAGLDPSTSYHVRVAAGLQDQTGGALQQEYLWGFSTITPKALGSLPFAGAQYAGPRDPIKIIFNQPMDLSSLRGAITLRRGGVDVPGTIAAGGSVPDATAMLGGEGQPGAAIGGWAATFTPAAPLDRGADYTLEVAQSARAAKGSGALNSAFSTTFRVAPLPSLAGSEPENGAAAAEPNGSIRLAFSAPMDWASVERNLTIDPKPTEIYTSTGQAEFYIYFQIEPDADYRVTVGAAARDLYGLPLGQDAQVAFHTASLPPSLALVGAYRLGSYNAYVPARVPVQHLGTPSASYELYRIDPAEVMALATDYDRWNDYTPAVSTLVKQGGVNLPGQRNEQRIDLLDLGRLEAGAYYLEVSGPNNAFDRQILAVSPYALTIKRSPEKLFVWAIDLATGKPASNIELTGAAYSYDASLRDEPVQLGRTDAEGILQAAFTARESFSPLFLWSPAGARFAFGTTNWGEGIGPWDFGLPADYAHSPVIGVIYTDRPIYRPDQNVYIRGALRTAQDERYTLPDQAQQAFLSITDPEGNAVYSATLALSEFGTFNASFPLERGARLGSYSMAVGYSGAAAGDGTSTPSPQVSGSFSVAEYRKPAFEVIVTPAKPDLIQGDALEVGVAAHYFSGGAVANAPVRWRLLADPLYFTPESAANFSFEDLDDAYGWYRWDASQQQAAGEQVADGQATTDGQGNFSLKLPATLGKDNHSRTLTLDVEVTDVDGQVIAAQGMVNLHAGAFYIGLRPDGYVVQAGQPQSVSIVTLDPQGQPVANRALKLSLYKRTWNSVRQQGADGRLYWTSSYSDTLIETKDATTDAQGRGSASFTPKDGGEYRIGAEGRDDAGHIVKSSAYSWVYGGDVFWGVNDTNRVDLIADKSSYKPGDTAGVLVTAPYKGMSALMTIERGEVIEHKLFTLQGTTELLQVPIRAEHAPNVYVSVVLVKPAGGDVRVPDLRVGLVNLPISTEQQELTISVTPDKPEAGPRDQVSYTVTATDHSGKGVRAEVGLALVDKAVLSLADDPNPTFKQAFYTRRPLGVFTSQSLTALVDRVTLKLQPGDKGGGGGANSEALIRRDFPDTAYWNPAVVTGDDGTAKVTLTLPDNLTTWRMIARGLTSDTRVGQVATDLVATKPLLVRPALPRFLTAGDKLAIQAVVQNSAASPIDATVTLEIEAQDGQAAGLLALGADAKQTVQAPANGTVVVRWPADARAAGNVRMRFTVQGGGLEDRVEQALRIQRFTTPEIIASAGQVYDTTVETIGAQPAIPGSQPADQGELDLELTPSLAAGVDSTLSYLEQYPYFCSEQTVSRFLPNAVTYRLVGALGQAPLQAGLKASLESNLAIGLQRLYALQHLDGGWGWWEDDDSQAYLSAYVVQGLIEAKRAGYAVDQARLDKGVAYLLSVLENQASDNQAAGASQLSALSARSYVLFVLNEAGQPDRGRTVALYEKREQLSIYGRAYLLMTLKAIGGEDDRVRVLVGNLMSTAIMHAADAHWEEPEQDAWNMSSDTRSTALALQALVRADPGNFLIPNAVRYLMGQRGEGHWRTTQESAVSLIALADYIAQSGELVADYTYSASLDGKMLKQGAVNRDNLKQPISIVMSLADLKLGGGSQLELQRQAAAGQTGQGRLYYTLRMRYAQDAAAVQALDQGIGVAREYSAVDTDTLSPTGQLVTQARLSDVVQVRLTITVPEDVRYLAVEDMLPAGLEPLDTSLRTTSAAARDAELQNADAERPYWWYFSQTSIHDNRVALFATSLPKGTYHYTYLARATTPGEFKTMPALAYQMYAPEVFGRSAGATFSVVAP
jgi:uncharacterized protein YfaS (alpha-2-macroglobulin family)